MIVWKKFPQIIRIMFILPFLFGCEAHIATPLVESYRRFQQWQITSRQDFEQWAHEVFLDGVKADSILMTKSLLSFGISPHARDTEQRTALMYAALHGHHDLARLLLDQGVGINIYDRNGWSPLILAAWNGHNQTVQLLLDYGARVNTPTRSGMTALLAAATRGHTELVSTLLDHGADIDSADQSGAHVLLRATSRGYADIVQLLFVHGAKNTSTDAYGWTALTEAVWNNQPTTATLLLEDPRIAPGALEKRMVTDFRKRDEKEAIVALLQTREER